MQKSKIVLIEDEEDTAILIKLQAEILGYKIIVEVDGLNGYGLIEKERPDLIILDVSLPGLSGLDICRKLKSDDELKDIPIILISDKTDEIDIILGLELGSDDYVTKPFSPKVLFSRVKAILRRKESSLVKAPKLIEFGPFILEADHYIVRRGDSVIALTLSEFGILKRLLLNKGKVLTRNHLLDDIQNSDAFVVDRNIDVHIASLRKKLGKDFDSIKTVRGVGYRFVES